MNTQDITKQLGGTPLRIISILSLISFIVLILSPLVWINIGWSPFWRLFLSSLFVNFLSRKFEKVFKIAIANAIEQAMKSDKENASKPDYKKSAFLEKLEKKMADNAK